MSAEYDARFVTYIPKRRRIIQISLTFALLVGIYALSGTLLLQTRGDDYNDEVDSRHMDTPGNSRDSLVGDRFRRRKSHLKQYCKNLSLNELGNKYDVTSHLIIDERRHLVYCFIEKIGCTFWLRVFQILNGFKNVTDPYQTRGMEAYGGFKTAQNIPFHTLNHIFTQSMKFLFVREPFGRLLSGYVDKMFLPTVPYWLNLERFIIEKFRQKTNVSRTKCGKAVTFAEFVEYFLYSEQTNDRRDMHFSLSFDHCRPCELDYDYIGKLETFEEDTTYILKEMKLNKTIEIKDFMEKSEKDAITLEIDWIYGVDKSVDDCIPRSERMFRAYRKLQIRGLISKDIPFPFSNETAMSIGIDELKQVFLDIHARSGPPEVRRTNRKEAFLEAYSSLPRDLLTRLQGQLKLDAELFGYDVYPDILKHAEGYNPQFSFFGTVHND